MARTRTKKATKSKAMPLNKIYEILNNPTKFSKAVHGSAVRSLSNQRKRNVNKIPALTIPVYASKGKLIKKKK